MRWRDCLTPNNDFFEKIEIFSILASKMALNVRSHELEISASVKLYTRNIPVYCYHKRSRIIINVPIKSYLITSDSY